MDQVELRAVREAIKLPLDDGRHALILEATAGVRWFTCAFVDVLSGESFPLGAENREYLLSRFRTVLNDSGDVAGVIEGRPVRWVLSLAEQHRSIYVSSDPAATRTLFMQDARGEVLRRAGLQPADVSAWRACLQSIEADAFS